MVMNGKPTGRASSLAGGLAVGALTAMTVTLCLAAITAKLIEREYLKENAIGYCAMGILAMSSFLGAMTAAAKIKRRRLMICMLSATIYLGLLLSMTGLFFGGQYSGVGVTALMVLCGAGLAILAGLGGQRGGKFRKKTGAYR